jgi:hypothetical protein
VTESVVVVPVTDAGVAAAAAATVGAVLLTVTFVNVDLLSRVLLLLLADRPTSTLDAIAIVTLPTWVHVVPSGETDPVSTLPARTSRTQ